MSFSRPDWVFFDLDDTLWDFKTNSMVALSHIFTNCPEIRSRFDSFDSFYDIYHFHNERLWKLFAEGNINADFLKRERFRSVLFPDDSSAETQTACARINSIYLSILAKQTCLIDGAVEILASLSRRFMIGVLTNGFREVQYQKLRCGGLDRYVQRMVISDETGFRKPDPAIFHYAADAVGACDSRCIMVGDNLHTDIKGALSAGWRAVWFDRDGKGDISSLLMLSDIL